MQYTDDLGSDLAPTFMLLVLGRQDLESEPSYFLESLLRDTSPPWRLYIIHSIEETDSEFPLRKQNPHHSFWDHMPGGKQDAPLESDGNGLLVPGVFLLWF